MKSGPLLGIDRTDGRQQDRRSEQVTESPDHKDILIVEMVVELEFAAGQVAGKAGERSVQRNRNKTQATTQFGRQANAKPGERSAAE